MTKPKEYRDTIQTGVSGLDEIFLGGVKANNIILLEGSSGSGKTTLGLEFIYRGAKDLKENGLIISFELSPQKLMRDAKGFGWDLASLQKKNKIKILYTNPSVILQELQNPDGVLINEIRAIDAKRILIDGLTPLKIFGELVNGRPFRDSLHLLVETLQRFGVTALLTRELHEGAAGSSGSLDHEQFVCDTIITLSNTTNQRNTHRYIEIKKSRGQDFISGQHTMRIEADKGVCVYRRTQSRPKEYNDQHTSNKKSSTGIPALDVIMGGGIYDGSITLAVGISGSGKTVLGVQFLLEGARKGKKGLHITLDEHPKQILRNARSLGLSLDDYVTNGDIIICYESPLELEMDVHFEKIVRIIEDNKIERVVVDSLAAYESSNPKEAHQFIYALTTYFKNKLITAYCNYESPELLGLSQISVDLKASAIVDNIVLLSYVEISTRLRRAVLVPKCRGASIPQVTREFFIQEGGIKIVEDDRGLAKEFEEVPQLPLSSYYGILSRAPARQSPLLEGKIQRGQVMPSSPKIV
ncbi:MAG TPA: ATPase domain-containing protein [Bacteriovoracaceae bacterium]|nr:ATPase domain-containing protein [Bacteriovoracaceae bacterium]